MTTTIINTFETVLQKLVPAAIIAIERGQSVRNVVTAQLRRPMPNCDRGYSLMELYGFDTDAVEALVDRAWLEAQAEIDMTFSEEDDGDRAEIVKAAQVAVRLCDRGATREEIHLKTRISLEKSLLPSKDIIEVRYAGRRTAAQCAASLAKIFDFDSLVERSLARARRTIRARSGTGDAWADTRDGIYGLDDARSNDEERYNDEIVRNSDTPDLTQAFGRWA